jgi:heme exporter protein CcmD
MPDWLSHPNAAYVIAAYGVAFFALFGLLLFSWCGYRRQREKWRRLSER